MKATFIAIVLVLLSLTVIRNFLVVNASRSQLVWVTDDNPTRRAQMEGFTRSTQLPIQIDPTNRDISKVIVQSIGGVGPDIFDCFDASQLSSYVQAGVAMDLTEQLKSEGIDLHAQVFAGSLGQCEYQGRVYGVPTNIVADGIWFHKELVPNPPTSQVNWDELASFAQKLTKRDSKGRVTQYGILFEWWNWKHFVASCGGKIFDAAGEKCTVDSPEATRGIQVMYDLVYKYRVSPSPSEEASMTSQGGWGSGAISYFGARRGAMAIGGRWWLASLSKYPDLNLSVLESPLENGGAPRAYGRATLVNKDSPRRDQAIKFLKYLASKEYGDIVDKGADGTPAFKRFSNTEGSNAQWTKIAETAVADQSSRYIDGSDVERLITLQLDQVKANSKSPAVAMRDAAREINLIIAKNRREQR